MPQNAPFLTVVDALLDESKPFPALYLHRFSDLEPDDLKKLTKAWPQVSPRRKHTLLEDLEDLAEADTLTSFDDLARSLLADPDPQVRTRAIRLLWECDDVKLVPVYLNILNNDEADEVQAAAANALGQFVYLGELDKIPAELYHTIEDQLLATTTYAKETLVRRRALESLGYSGREGVIPLIEAAYREKGPDWMVSALFAMGRSCNDRWRKQVLSQLRSPDEDIRSEAIHAAGELELESARPVLLDILEDEEDMEVRRELIWALSKIGGEGVRAKLEELLEIKEDDEEADFIEEALDTLSFTEDMGNFSLFDVDPEVDFIEEEPDEEG
ncbi:MAG TPA: HEAT repeat domain-containing protein [Anaerolineales bacterium]